MIWPTFIKGRCIFLDGNLVLHSGIKMGELVNECCN